VVYFGLTDARVLVRQVVYLVARVVSGWMGGHSDQVV